MKFNKGFGVVLEPNYNIKEEVSEEEIRSLGNHWYEHADTGLVNGGSFRWTLASITDKPIQEEFVGLVPVQLMRLWSVQMVNQLVHDNASVDHYQSEPKFNITPDEKIVFNGIMTKICEGLNECLEDSSNEMVMKIIKKEFNFNENE